MCYDDMTNVSSRQLKDPILEALVAEAEANVNEDRKVRRFLSLIYTKQ